jgi:hypothetical protein
MVKVASVIVQTPYCGAKRKDNKITAYFNFSETQISVRCVDETTGKEQQTQLNFDSSEVHERRVQHFQAQDVSKVDLQVIQRSAVSKPWCVCEACRLHYATAVVQPLWAHVCRAASARELYDACNRLPAMAASTPVATLHWASTHALCPVHDAGPCLVADWRWLCAACLLDRANLPE